MSHDMFPDGLLESTKEDILLFDECFASAIPFTALHRDRDDTAKFVQWDNAWVEYLRHRQKLLDHEGRVNMFPWNIYYSLGLKWSQGYAFSQGAIGTCSRFGVTNAIQCNRLITTVRLGRKDCPEINPNYAYAVARGNGTPRWGSGANLNPLAKWIAEIGCHLVSDVGPYDANGSSLKKVNATTNANALKNQPTIIYVPGKDTPKFDDVFLAVQAGVGVCMGSGVYAVTAEIGASGLAEASQFKNGGHSQAFVEGIIENGKRYLYLLNSHGATRYKGDKYYPNGQPGCWYDEQKFQKIASGAYRYGNWFCPVSEMSM
jgi:hypothetical protein